MNLKDIKVIDKEVSFDLVSEYIDFVVNSAYDENGVYHEYLKDYAEILSIISLYTDYGKEDLDISEVMNFYWDENSNWNNIKKQLGYKWEMFDYYVIVSIKYKNTPMRFADQAMNTVMEFIKQFADILNKIDFEALNQYDFSSLIQAANAVNDKIENNEST